MDESLAVILNDLRTILEIPHNFLNIQTTVDTALSNIKIRNHIEDFYDNWVYENMESSKVQVLIVNIRELCRKIATYSILAPFKGNYECLLSNIKYLGQNPDTVLGIFKSLAIKSKKDDVSSILSSISVAFDGIEMCTEKLLFTMIMILKEMKLNEEVAILCSPFIVGGKLC